MEPTILFVLTMLIVLIASVVQRLTGMGFALTSAPPLVLMYGADEGVKTSVVTGLVLSVLMVSTIVRDVDWRPSGWLVLGGVCAAPLGAWVTAITPTRWLSLIVGVFAALSLMGGAWRGVQRALTGTRGAVLTGSLSGFMHVASGLAGPPLAMYALQNRWDQRRFAASIQIVFIALSLLTLGLRGMPQMPIATLAPLCAAVLAGLVLGAVAARHVPARWARRGMLTIAWAGTLTVLARGVIELF